MATAPTVSHVVNAGECLFRRAARYHAALSPPSLAGKRKGFFRLHFLTLYLCFVSFIPGETIPPSILPSAVFSTSPLRRSQTNPRARVFAGHNVSSIFLEAAYKDKKLLLRGKK